MRSESYDPSHPGPAHPGGAGPARRWTDMQSALDHLETLRDRAGAALRGYAEARDEVGDLTSEGFSDDGAVRAVVDDSGEVAAIDIPDDVARRPTGVGRLVVTAIHRAQAEHARKMAELTARMGGGADMRSLVRDAIPPELHDPGRRDRDDRRW